MNPDSLKNTIFFRIDFTKNFNKCCYNYGYLLNKTKFLTSVTE